MCRLVRRFVRLIRMPRWDWWVIPPRLFVSDGSAPVVFLSGVHVEARLTSSLGLLLTGARMSKRSFQNILVKVIRDTYWLEALAWLSADHFWFQQLLLRLFDDYFSGSFEKHGKQVYKEHYRELEELLGGPSSRRYLSWTVEDGW